MYAAFLSVFVATVITMIVSGVETKEHVINEVTTEVGFREGFLAVTNIIFAYRMLKSEFSLGDVPMTRANTTPVAHVAYFGFMSETEDPRTFNKSLAMLQIIDTVLYLVAALIIYHYVGPDVKSPAILSLSPLMSKIAWGISIPTVSFASLYLRLIC